MSAYIYFNDSFKNYLIVTSLVDTSFKRVPEKTKDKHFQYRIVADCLERDVFITSNYQTFLGMDTNNKDVIFDDYKRPNHVFEAIIKYVKGIDEETLLNDSRLFNAFRNWDTQDRQMTYKYYNYLNKGFTRNPLNGLWEQVKKNQLYKVSDNQYIVYGDCSILNFVPKFLGFTPNDSYTVYNLIPKGDYGVSVRVRTNSDIDIPKFFSELTGQSMDKFKDFKDKPFGYTYFGWKNKGPEPDLVSNFKKFLDKQ